MSDIVECSFCDRTHELRKELAALLELGISAGTLADIGSEGWRIYLTGSAEATVICDRCALIYDASAAAIATGIDQVAAARERRAQR